jgi:hypothetical protein
MLYCGRIRRRRALDDGDRLSPKHFGEFACYTLRIVRSAQPFFAHSIERQSGVVLMRACA